MILPLRREHNQSPECWVVVQGFQKIECPKTQFPHSASLEKELRGHQSPARRPGAERWEPLSSSTDGTTLDGIDTSRSVAGEAF